MVRLSERIKRQKTEVRRLRRVAKESSTLANRARHLSRLADDAERVERIAASQLNDAVEELKTQEEALAVLPIVVANGSAHYEAGDFGFLGDAFEERRHAGVYKFVRATGLTLGYEETIHRAPRDWYAKYRRSPHFVADDLADEESYVFVFDDIAFIQDKGWRSFVDVVLARHRKTLGLPETEPVSSATPPSRPK